MADHASTFSSIAESIITESMEALQPRQAQASALSHLRKESLDIYNRLHSIAEDIEFVKTVRATYPRLPILPNQRCGLWYVDPRMARQEPAYFKSTDGHFGNWGFNLRRPNLHLLSMIVSEGGMILVDSTRAGKRIPDALSKTVPIWCAVINRAVQRKYPDRHRDAAGWDLALYCPSGTVSAQEQAQIEARLDGWVDSLVGSSYILSDLLRPLHPFWITPSTTVFPRLDGGQAQPFYPVVCVSASKQIYEGMERRSNGFVYVQGSGDDHELWGMGLTPKLFWTHKTELLTASRSALPELIRPLAAPHATRHSPHAEWTVRPTPIAQVGGRLLLGTTGDLPAGLPRSLPGGAAPLAYLTVSAAPGPGDAGTFGADHVLRLQMADGRKEQLLYLQTVLPRAMAFVGARLARGDAVCICCDSGTDASVGVALAALQLFFDDTGAFAGSPQEQDALRTTATKQSIGTRLQWIIASRPAANPSRATLKRVNEYILSPPAFRRQRATE